MATVEATAAQAAHDAQVACGNPSFAFKYDWAVYEQLDYAAVAGTDKERVMQSADMFAKAVSKAMVEACSDPTYKAEISKITEMQLKPRNVTSDNYRLVFTKSASTVTATYNAFALNGSQEIAKDLEKAL